MATVKELDDYFFAVQWDLKEFLSNTGSNLLEVNGRTNFLCQSEQWLPRTRYSLNFTYNATTSKLILSMITSEKGIYF